MSTSRGRQVNANQVVFDQADFFQPDAYTRVTGLTTANVTVQVFFNNALQAWTLASGVGLTDAQLVAGVVYWQEVQPGFYGLRLRPNALGYWRLIVSYPAGTQTLALDYDVVSSPASSGGTGLRSTFAAPTG